MNDLFVEQTILNDDNVSLPAGVPQLQSFLNLVSTTPAEVELMQLGKQQVPTQLLIV